MIELEKNPSLESMLQYVEEHIEGNDLNPAANLLRTLGEHMAKWLIIDAKLWDEACMDESGKKHRTPHYGRCVYLLSKNRIIDKSAYEEVFRPLQKYGNKGSHEIGNIEKYEIIYVYNKTKEYTLNVFLRRYPKATRQGILPSSKEENAEVQLPVSTQRVNSIDAAIEKQFAKEGHKSVKEVIETANKYLAFMGYPILRGHPGAAFRYWDNNTKTYRIRTSLWEAKEESHSNYDIVYVFYSDDGEIDHFLTEGEIDAFSEALDIGKRLVLDNSIEDGIEGKAFRYRDSETGNIKYRKDLFVA